MPPNAEIGSQSYAFSKAWKTSLSRATPQGLLCLIMQAPGPFKSRKMRKSAYTSTMLLKDNSLPCSCSNGGKSFVSAGLIAGGWYQAEAECGFSPYRRSWCLLRLNATDCGMLDSCEASLPVMVPPKYP